MNQIFSNSKKIKRALRAQLFLLPSPFGETPPYDPAAVEKDMLRLLEKAWVRSYRRRGQANGGAQTHTAAFAQKRARAERAFALSRNFSQAAREAGVSIASVRRWSKEWDIEPRYAAKKSRAAPAP